MAGFNHHVETRRVLRFLRDAAGPAGFGIVLGIFIFLAATSQSRSSQALSPSIAPTSAPATPFRVVGEGSRRPRALPFASCAAARVAGAAPVLRGQPGYGEHLDRDRDGIACEPYPR